MTEPAILQEVRDETTPEDTIELELTPEDVISLSRAAAVEQDPKRPDTVAARMPSVANFHEANAHETICNVTGRRPAGRLIGVVATTIAIVVLGSAAYRAMSPRVLQPHRADDAVASSSRQSEPELPQHQRPNVRFTNPFDSSEVFEFPAGTSEAEANELVANILLQRARDRRQK